MSDIYPITLERYNDWEKAGLIDENQIYQIYDTDEDIAKELIRTRKALGIAVDALKELKPQKAKGGGYWAVKSTDAIKLINKALEQITALEQNEHFADASKKIEQKDK